MKTPRRALATVWVACLLAATATGCGSVSVRKLRPGPARELARVASPFVASPADEWLARAEAAYDAGRAEEEAKETERAADLYLDAVGDAGRVLEDPASEEGGLPTLTRAEAAQAISNAALARFLRLTSGRTMRLDESWRAGLARRGVRVTIRRDEAVWDPESFDVLKFSADFAVLGLENQHRVEGLGVPLIAIRRAHLSDLFRRKGPEDFLMPRQVYPVTAVLRVTHPGDARSGLGPEAILELHDPVRYRRVSLSARPHGAAGGGPVHPAGVPPRPQPPADPRARRPAPAPVARGARRALHAPPVPAGQDSRRPGPRGLVQPPRLAPGDQRPPRRPGHPRPLPVLDLPLSHGEPRDGLGRHPPQGPQRGPRRPWTRKGPTRRSIRWSWSATAWADSWPR